MAILIYPTETLLLQRDTSLPNPLMTETILSIIPNTIIYIDSGSNASNISASYFYITASSATSASWALSQNRAVVLCNAFTPTVSGSDGGQILMPYGGVNGTTPVSWSVKRINFRSEAPESTTSSITIEKSLGSGSFSAVSLGTASLVSASYESYNISPGTTINSGDKMRFNVNTLGTATNWAIIVEIHEL